MKRWACIVVVMLGAAAAADVIHLQDGTKLEGTIRRGEGGWIVTDSAGKVTAVPDAKVESIEKTGGPNAPSVAESRLEVLRRSVDQLSDLSIIIERYNQFIEQYKGSAGAKLAEKDLEVWKDRQARGLVKVGDAWLTPQEHAARLAKTATVVEEIRGLIKDGKYKDAEGVVNKLLAADADSVSGQYLRGVVMYRLDQLGQAKKSFELVRERLSSHGPTLNNLGVIAWRQKHLPTGLALLDQAMQASPNNRQILDNVAELLRMVKASDRESAVGRRAALRFQEQDAELGKQLAGEGLERWGAIYVNKEQKAEVKKIQAKLDLLAEDYRKIKVRITELEQKLDDNERMLRQIDSDRRIHDSNSNRVIITRPPRIYYDLKRENDSLESERLRLLESLDSFAERERQVWMTSPIKPFTGMLRIIEAEGTPLAPAAVGGTPATTTAPGQ